MKIPDTLTAPLHFSSFYREGRWLVPNDQVEEESGCKSEATFSRAPDFTLAPTACYKGMETYEPERQ